MPVIADTAYPRLAANPSPVELEEAFSPSIAELGFTEGHTRRPGPRLALLVLLKTFQRLGYFVPLANVPSVIVAHVATRAGLASAVGEVTEYDGTSYRRRLMAMVRSFLGVTAYDRGGRNIVVQASIEAARTRDDLPDIINVAIEELLRKRYELPAFGTLLRIGRTARALINRGYHRRIAAAMTVEVRQRLASLLVVLEGASRSGWDQVKTEALRPSPQRMREFLAHLNWLRAQAADGVFIGIPDQKNPPLRC